MSKRLADWTKGAEAIVYQACAVCGSVQYFHRSFCCACGAPDPVEKAARGEGTVYATSLVCRAATPETRAHVPYNIVLVDTAEGFRMMAHGEIELAIGDRVNGAVRAVRRADRAIFREGEMTPQRHCERSEAIHASASRMSRDGLLRRFAPRNDEFTAHRR